MFAGIRERKQGLHIYVAIDNNAPTVRAHNLDSTTARFAALFRLLRNDHRRHETANHLGDLFIECSKHIDGMQGRRVLREPKDAV